MRRYVKDLGASPEGCHRADILPTLRDQCRAMPAGPRRRRARPIHFAHPAGPKGREDFRSASASPSVPSLDGLPLCSQRLLSDFADSEFLACSHGGCRSMASAASRTPRLPRRGNYGSKTRKSRFSATATQSGTMCCLMANRMRSAVFSRCSSCIRWVL